MSAFICEGGLVSGASCDQLLSQQIHIFGNGVYRALGPLVGGKTLLPTAIWKCAPFS